ncbi:unnamed protein product [Dicrocoelium dendriticum]|nr:unnamed protein product [Dicrocoelium dendriticum]
MIPLFVDESMLALRLLLRTFSLVTTLDADVDFDIIAPTSRLFYAVDSSNCLTPSQYDKPREIYPSDQGTEISSLTDSGF